MISTKFVSSAAALALIAALNLPTASFAFHGGGGGHFGGGGGHFGGGWGGGHFSGGGGMRFSGGAPVARSFAVAPAARFTGAGPTGGVAWHGGQTAWSGNNGAWHGGFHHHRFFPGAFAAGVAVGALGSYAYYGGPDYYYDSGYGDTYYDNGTYDDGTTVAVVPVAPSGDASYCAQTYRSYDPASGTYLGFDGLRHPCP